MYEFFSMGGYAVYVWGSFGLVAAVLVYNYFAPRRRVKKILRRLVETAADDAGAR